MVNYLKKLIRHDFWSIGLISAPIWKVLGTSKVEAVKSIRWLRVPVPKCGFLADPFGFYRNGDLYIAAEYFDYKIGYGQNRLYKLVQGERLELVSPVGVSHTKYHQSYPYIIEENGELYSVPEESCKNQVGLYKLDLLSGCWCFHEVLIKGVSAVDPTVIKHDERWWMFFTDSRMGSDSHLCIWYADALKGPWKPHKKTPVKINFNGARSAGTPFTHNGMLYRPAQDCTMGYGSGVVVNKVTVLSVDDFQEVPVRVLKPDPSGPYPNGIHTLSAVRDVTLVDGKRLAFCAAAFTLPFRRRLNRIIKLKP